MGVAQTSAFRVRAEHLASKRTPTFQLLIDLFLIETSRRRGFASWDSASGHFTGCSSEPEPGSDGAAWAPSSTQESKNGIRMPVVVPPQHMTGDHCRLPLEFHLMVDFPHTFRLA